MAAIQGRLQDKVAIITGAASGIGAESARLFAREGASVLIADINDGLGASVAREICQNGGKAVFKHTDVSHESDIIAMIDATVEHFGRLNILFNNAGGASQTSGTVGETTVERTTAEDWDACYALNLRSVCLGIKYALPLLRQAGGGSIISTGSDAGLRGIPGHDPYNALKAGVHMLSVGLAQTLGVYNIRINAIAPGWIATPMLLAGFSEDMNPLEKILPIAQPIKRAGRASDIAHAALFLASDDASFISGIVLPVDGGWLAQGDQNAAMTLHMATQKRPKGS